MKTFGERLKELRQEKGLTQEQLGKLINLSKANISKYESNSIEPSMDTINFLVEYFKCPVSYLLGKTDNRTSVSKSYIENDTDVFKRLGKIIKRDSKPLTDKDKKKILKVIEAAWPDDEEDDDNE